MSETALARAIAAEQEFVDLAYGLLDAQSTAYRERLHAVRTMTGLESPGELTERDSFAAHYEDALSRLAHVENRLVLGRLDTTDGETRHIGRIGLAHDNQDIALLDWRAPQAVPFYQATAAHPGGVALRRHIATRLRKVTGVEDELLDVSAGTREANLTGEGALMSALKAARNGKMGDIVATIQAEQDRVIRAPGSGVLVVQGGPGTGKTAVALHRAAYLLYAERGRLARSGVLVVGPSRRFLAYIDQVLPSLGESDVVSVTLGTLVPGLSAKGTERAALARLKGRAVWRKICRRAVREILERPLEATVRLKVGSATLRLRPDHVRAAQEVARETGKPHNLARDAYARHLVRILARQAAKAAKTTLEDSPWITADVAGNVDVRREVNLHWLPSSPLDLLERMWARPHLLARAAKELTPDERASLVRERGSALTIGDIALIDELADVLGPYLSPRERALETARKAEREQLSAYVGETMSRMSLGGGIVSAADFAERQSARAVSGSIADQAAADRRWTYGHVVVDEAQELTPMQWEMIMRRCPSRSMTIVGDVDQRQSGAPEGGWRALLGRLGTHVEERELTVSYRTPGEILRQAAGVLGAAGAPVRPVKAAREEKDCLRMIPSGRDGLCARLAQAVAEETSWLDANLGEGAGLVAVIVPESLAAELRQAFAADPSLASAMKSVRDAAPRVSMLTARQSKGLEYDCVVLAEPDALLAEGPGALYVAMTRPTRRLALVHSRPLPAPLVH